MAVNNQRLQKAHLISVSLEGKCHITENGFAVYSASRSPVISSGGRMRYNSTVKNRYSFDEPRNLSCAWEYRSFPVILEL
jgi:hypothetical protein